jgi:SAM-dependent methyltransferase
MKYEECDLIFDTTGLYVKINDVSKIEPPLLTQGQIDIQNLPVRDLIVEKIKSFSTGKILEIGYGLGNTSNIAYMQSHSLYTIIESHPQVLQKLNVWASDKKNVEVIAGKWQDNISLFDTQVYDIIFYDSSDIAYDWNSLLEVAKRILTPQGVLMFYGAHKHIPISLYSDTFTNTVLEQDSENSIYNTVNCLSLKV